MAGCPVNVWLVAEAACLVQSGALASVISQFSSFNGFLLRTTFYRDRPFIDQNGTCRECLPLHGPEEDKSARTLLNHFEAGATYRPFRPSVRCGGVGPAMKWTRRFLPTGRRHQ